MASKIRAALLQTATRHFSEKGYCGTATKEIAVDAGVTEGSLFRLFNSKDQLFAESLGAALANGSGRATIRLVAFALLEAKGLSADNRKAIIRLKKKLPAVKALAELLK